MNRSIDNLLDDMVAVYNEEQTVISESNNDNDLSVDDLEKRMSDMMDKKLAEVAKNNTMKGENNTTSGNPTHIETTPATDGDTGTDGDTDGDTTNN